MTGFLQKIAQETAARLTMQKKSVPESILRDMPLFSRNPHDVTNVFKTSRPNIIAEVKFASPASGMIHTHASPSAGAATHIAGGYLAAGAAMLSILTEPAYFKGSLDYLAAVRMKNPDAILLRKDFMIDPYQMLEARAHGADAVLIILAMTDAVLSKDLYDAALDLNLTPLIEIHDAAELESAITLGANFIGVNNRNLKTLKIDLDTSRMLAALKPANSVFISESGLSSPVELKELSGLGYDGFLMGSSFMKHADPGAELEKMITGVACV